MAWIEHRNTKAGPRSRVVWYEDGEKQRVTFTDPGDATQFRDQVKAFGDHWPPGWTKPAKAAAPSNDKFTFDAWARRTIANRSRANQRTKADYLRDLDRHFALLLPLPLADIDDDDVTAWTADRIKAELADKTIRNLHGFASSLFVDAMTQHPPLVERNPFAKRLGDLATVRTEEMVFLTPDEFATVLGWVREEYRPLIRLLAGTGLRYGEATALTVRDVQVRARRRTLTVTKAWKRTGTATWEIGEPKTRRSRRTLSLSPRLVDMLAPLVDGRRSGDLVFPGRGGGRLPHVEVYKRGWAPAVARARVCEGHYAPQRNGRGMPPLMPAPCDCPGMLDKAPRIHDLRHSHASWLIAEGVPLAAISRRLGHSSITITVDRYGHLDPSLDAQVDAATDRALGDAEWMYEMVTPQELPD